MRTSTSVIAGTMDGWRRCRPRSSGWTMEPAASGSKVECVCFPSLPSAALIQQYLTHHHADADVPLGFDAPPAAACECGAAEWQLQRLDSCSAAAKVIVIHVRGEWLRAACWIAIAARSELRSAAPASTHWHAAFRRSLRVLQAAVQVRWLRQAQMAVPDRPGDHAPDSRVLRTPEPVLPARFCQAAHQWHALPPARLIYSRHLQLSGRRVQGAHAGWATAEASLCAAALHYCMRHAACCIHCCSDIARPLHALT